ncbi:MAG TPA: protein translocase subunit SecD [Actinomycetota bacterium]|nr:protein translocase subunit SecD [Actinomycetota bacterium]
MKRATRNLWISIIFVGALVVASIAAFVTGTRPVLGLDLEGGVSVILSAPPSTPHDVMERALENIRRRVDAFGVGEPLLYLSGTNIEVQLPGLARGTIQQRPIDRYRIVDQKDVPYGTYTGKDAADTALQKLAVAPGAQTFCLTGDIYSGTTTGGASPAPSPSPGTTSTGPCFGSRKDANTVLSKITVVPASKASPAPATGTTKNGSYCLNGTQLQTAPCFDSKEAATQAKSGIRLDVTTNTYCVYSAPGKSISSSTGDACFPEQAQAQKLLSDLTVFHQTTNYCVVSSAGTALGCFLTRDQATEQLQATGQERLLQVIGTTARLEQRQVTGTLTPSDPNYEATPVTCGTPEERSTPACSFQALAKKPIVVYGAGNLSSTKYQLGPVLITGDEIKKATAVYNSGGSSSVATGWEIDFQMTSSGAKTLSDVTSQMVGKNLAIVVDNRVISAPVVNEAIPNGNGVIQGSFTKARAQDLATQLNAGALPVNLKKEQVQTVSPTLGKESLHQGLVAGIAGLILLAIYLLFYYRLLGLVAWAGMTIWAILAIALVSIAGRTVGYSLTLAGIAGLVISLGVTADSYIVFFERLKDEVRHGKTPRAAVQPAFKRAYKTIVAADVITGLAAVVLYLTAISSVRGFALTLGVATLLDLFVVYFFKRPTVFLIARNERLVNMHGFGLTSGVAAEPLPGEMRPAIAGGSK